MARLFTCGYESQHYFSDGFTSATSASPLFSYDTITKRIAGTRASGKYNSGSPSALAITHISFTSTNGYYYYYRVYLRFPSLTGLGTTGIITFRDNNGIQQLTVRVAANNNFTLYNNSTSTILYTAPNDTLAVDTWYCFEVGIMVSGNAATDSYAAIRLDGNLLYESSVQQYGTTALGGLRTGWIVAPSTANSIVYADDAALNNNQGADQNTWPGEGRVWLSLTISDNTRGANWYCDNAATSNLYDALNNTPPVGVAHAPATMPATAQIYNVVNSSTHPAAVMDVDMQSYNTVGIGSGETIKVVVLSIDSGTNGTTARAHNAYIESNPAETPGSNFNTPAAACGTYPTNWKHTWRTTLYAPSVTRSTSPVVSIHKEVNNVAAIDVCYAGITIESQPTAIDRYGMGRAGVSVQQKLMPIGRAMLAIQRRLYATGRAALSASQSAIQQATGRAALRGKQTLQSVGLMRLFASSKRMATGRARQAISIRLMATGRESLHIANTMRATGRALLRARALYQATGRAILSAGLTATRRAVGRARMAITRRWYATGRARLSRSHRWYATGLGRFGLRTTRMATGRSLVGVRRSLVAMGRAVLRIYSRRMATGRASIRGGTTRRAVGRARFGLDAAWVFMGRARFAIKAKQMATGLMRFGLASRKRATGRALVRIRGLWQATGRARMAVGNITRLFAIGRARMRVARLQRAKGRMGLGLASRSRAVGRTSLRGMHKAYATGRAIMRGKSRKQATGRVALRGKHVWRPVGRAIMRAKGSWQSTSRALFSVTSKRYATGKSWLVVGVWAHAIGRAKLLVRYTIQMRAIGRMNLVAPEVLFVVFQASAQETIFAASAQDTGFIVTVQEAAFQASMQETIYTVPAQEATFPTEEP